jgi:hypothetical protein
VIDRGVGHHRQDERRPGLDGAEQPVEEVWHGLSAREKHRQDCRCHAAKRGFSTGCEEAEQDITEPGLHRHPPDRVAVVSARFRGPHQRRPRVPRDIAPGQKRDFGRHAEAAKPAQRDQRPPLAATGRGC